MRRRPHRGPAEDLVHGRHHSADRIAAELLVRRPHPADYARRHPLRTLRYVGHTWFATRAKLARKLRRRSADDRHVGTNAWLTEDVHVLRQRMNLPMEQVAPAQRKGPQAELSQSAAIG